MEVQRPVGVRLGRTAERNALVAVNKEAEILRQQQIQIAHEINAAIMEVQRAQKVLDLTSHRREIALSHLSAMMKKFEEGIPIPIEQVLEAQRAVHDADTAVSIAAVDRSIAINNLLVARGTYLEDLGLMMLASPKGPSNVASNQVWQGLVPQTTPQVDLGTPQSLHTQPLPEIQLLPPQNNREGQLLQN